VDRINAERACHIITIEDPIEFLHSHKRSTVHQRELYTDAPSFALALRAALRQAPKLILVGEMRDRETIEVALDAAETGHLVYSTLHTIDAAKTVERIIGAFALSDQLAVRTRLAKSFSYIVSQRLIPARDGGGRVAAFEILKSTLRTREYVQRGEGEGKPCWMPCGTARRKACSILTGRLRGLSAPARSISRRASPTPRIRAICGCC
jgi:twitching motility protein PilT